MGVTSSGHPPTTAGEYSSILEGIIEEFWMEYEWEFSKRTSVQSNFKQLVCVLVSIIDKLCWNFGNSNV